MNAYFSTRFCVEGLHEVKGLTTMYENRGCWGGQVIYLGICGNLESARDEYQNSLALHAYRESLRLRRELGQESLAMGVLARIARAAVAQDDVESAIAHVAKILAYPDEGGSLPGTWQPLRFYLTCYQVLDLAGDARTGAILESAYQMLQEWAGRIPEAGARHTYLESVPWHREITAAYQDRPK